MAKKFEFLLCSCDPDLIQPAVAAGIDALVVEWEKIDRQIERSDTENLQRVRNCTEAWVICRLSPYDSKTAQEIKTAIACGANEILLPKVRTIEEVENVLEWVNDRVRVGIVVETVGAIELTSKLAQLPLSRVHIGLNDLAEELQNPNRYTAIVDGTLERIFKDFNVPCGFGGLTLPDKGFPIPCRLLMGEMLRLQCSFSLLRRSFIADIVGGNLKENVLQMRQALAQLGDRTSSEIERDRAILYQTLDRLSF